MLNIIEIPLKDVNKNLKLNGCYEGVLILSIILLFRTYFKVFHYFSDRKV